MGAVLRLVGTGQEEPPAGADLEELWREYLISYGCSVNTANLRLAVLRILMRHARVSDPLHLTREHVLSWLAQPIKQWTRVTYFASARQFSTWLREFGHDPNSNLVEGIPTPKSPAPVARPITDAVVDKMLRMKLPPRAHAYVRLALFEALRVSSLCDPGGDDAD